MRKLIILITLFSCSLLIGNIIYIPASYPTIQQGIDNASNGDTVLVDNGIYFENLEIDSLNIWLTSWFIFTGNKADIVSTVIDGNNNGVVIHIFDQAEPPDDSYTDVTHIIGLTIQHAGNTDEGGGVWCDMSDAEISFNIIRWNHVWGHGGGIAAHEGGSPTVFNNYIYENSSDFWSGGMHLYRCRAKIFNNYFWGNTATMLGGAIGIDSLWVDSTPETADTSFIINNTIIGNSAEKGGGIAVWRYGSAFVFDNIIRDNENTDEMMANGAQVFAEGSQGPSHLYLDYNDIEGGYSSIQIDAGCTVDYGTGNFDLPPQFVNPTMPNPDYHLTSTSPCIDTGMPNPALWDVPAVEWDLDPRIFISDIDVGADEFIEDEQYCCEFLITDFNDLTLYDNYHVLDQILTNGIAIDVMEFTYSDGTTTADGVAQVVPAGTIGSDGFEVTISNISLGFAITSYISGMEIQFAEYGGNVNININGVFVNVENFAVLDGTVIGGVRVHVDNGFGNDVGTITLCALTPAGITDFIIGGQELWIDCACIVDCDEDDPEIEGCDDPATDFEDLVVGDTYWIGNTFYTYNVAVTPGEFLFSDGAPFYNGSAEINNLGWSGGTGNEVVLNNTALDFDFGTPISGLELLFGETGGNLNININGDFYNFDNMQDIHGIAIGGISIEVVGGFGNDQGVLTMCGNNFDSLQEFSIGGQEFVIDDLCIIPCEMNIGACCIEEECVELSEDECLELGGEFFGNNVPCNEHICGGFECVESPYGFGDPCYDWVIYENPACCENLWDFACQEMYDSCEPMPCSMEDLGDLDMNGFVNVVDIVSLVDVILNGTEDPYLKCAGDLDFDGDNDVVDIVLIVDMILGSGLEKGQSVNDAVLKVGANELAIETDGNVAGIQFTTSSEIEILQTMLPDGWELYNNGETFLMFSTDGSGLTSSPLFRFDGDLQLDNIIVADWYGNNVTASLVELPKDFVLSPAYPNPFNPVTTLEYSVPENSVVNVTIYDVSGRLIETLVNDKQEPGNYSLQWDAADLSSGIYLVKMEANNFAARQKLVLVK